MGKTDGIQRKTHTVYHWSRVLLVTIFGLIGSIILVIGLLGVLYLLNDSSSGNLFSSGDKRRYLLHVPEKYDPAIPSALVISLHGFSSWPNNQRQVSRWDDLADEEGFIVVFPAGTRFPKRWHASILPESSADAMKDVVFISDLIVKLESDFNIDSTRIYVNGFSNGGGMTFYLGCELSGQVAAIGTVSGAFTYPLKECKPSRPVPMILFHGIQDPIVPYFGGPSRSFDIPFPDIPAWARDRALLNGCDFDPAETSPALSVVEHSYCGCDQGAAVDFYSIDGNGHAWPGGDPLPEWVTGPTSNAVSATRLMWEFFQQYTLSKP